MRLRQFADLESQDFEHHPVWIGCHNADYGEPWYDDTDEETFRPWSGALPVTPSQGMLLVRATFKLPEGSRYLGFVTPSLEEDDLKTQQPQVFVSGRRFSFWGGIGGITIEDQQALYHALGKTPGEIFPLHFRTDPGLATGINSGRIDGFYQITPSGTQIKRAELTREVFHARAHSRLGVEFFQVFARGSHGFPQPEDRYKDLTYDDVCRRCGIHGKQASPFRFKKSGRSTPPGFSQMNWVFDTFFVHPEIAAEIGTAGLAGISFGPALDHRTGTELSDRVQLHIPTIFPCAETSKLPTVTCRPKNEEELGLRAKGYEKFLQMTADALAGIPYCGRVKYHVPTTLAIKIGTIDDAPDLFQTAEWFGSGALAYRLTLASDRFMALVRERGWKGLAFRAVQQGGWSERTTP